MTGYLVWIFAVSVGLCCVTASVVLSNEKAIELGIPTPPHITSPSRQKVDYIIKSDPVTLNCKATGDPRVRYQWRWNGNRIPENNSAINEDPESGLLKIESFTDEEEGYFQCFASNDHGVALSQVTELRTRVDPIFRNIPRPDYELTVEVGQGVKLECDDRPFSRPPGRWYWYHVTSSAGQQQIPIANSDRMDIDVNGTLYITNASETDTGDTYACAVSSDLLDSVHVAKTPYLRLTVIKNTVHQTKPSVLGYTGYATADSGGEVMLECFFDGQPKPIITWLTGWNDRVIVNGTDKRFLISTKSHKLRIKRLTDDDQGKYICKAANVMGIAAAETFLNVTSRPLFQGSNPQILVTTEGSNATFSCLAKGSFQEMPLPPPVWTVNGKAVASVEGNFSVSADGIRLTVINPTKDDFMCVQCNVTNSRGYAFGDGYLAVIDPLELTSQPNRSVEIEPRTPHVNLTIVAQADPCCELIFSWYFEGRELSKTALRQPPFSYYPGHNQATLSIQLNGTTEERLRRLMGEYRCDVWHSAYSYKKTVSVTVSRKADKAKLVAAGPNYWWVAVVGGVCLLIMAVIIIALMIRFNFPRQEYLCTRSTQDLSIPNQIARGTPNRGGPKLLSGHCSSDPTTSRDNKTQHCTDRHNTTQNDTTEQDSKIEEAANCCRIIAVPMQWNMRRHDSTQHNTTRIDTT